MTKFFVLTFVLLLPSVSQAAPKVWSYEKLLTIAQWCTSEQMVSAVKEIYGVDLGLGGVTGSYLQGSYPTLEKFEKDPNAAYPIQGWSYYASFNGCTIELSPSAFVLRAQTPRCAMKKAGLASTLEFRGFETARIYAQAYFYDVKKDHLGNVLSQMQGFVNPYVVYGEREVSLVTKSGERTAFTLDFQVQKNCLERFLR